MAQAHKAIRVEHERKMCLACGYRGRILQGDRGLITFQCPSCGCDLYSRPPRSYAEMEGFVAPAPDETARLPQPARSRTPEKQHPRARYGVILERLLAWSLLITLSIAIFGGIAAAAL